MDPYFNHLAADQHAQDLFEEAERRRTAGSGRTARPRTVTVRYFENRDIEAIRRLAVLDDKPDPDGRVLVADVDGRVVAALPFPGGEPIADPFVATSDLVELLKLRAEQLTPPRPRHRGLLGRFALVSRAGAA